MSEGGTPRRPDALRRRRGPVRPLGPVLGVLAVLAAGAVAASRLWTDLLWFRSVGAGQVFRTRLVAGLLLALAWGTLGTAVVLGNLRLAVRLRPRTRNAAPSALVNRTRDVLETRRRQSAVAASLLVGAGSALAGWAQRDLFLAWRHATPFGTRDPWFGRDVGFYVFDLPWWRSVLQQAWWVLSAATVLVAATHVLTGAAQSFTVTTTPRGQTIVSRRPARLAPGAQSQLAVLGGVLMLLAALSVWLGRYGYATTDNWLSTGIAYTDLHARVVARTVVATICLLCALLLFVTARTRRWVVPTTAVVLALVASLLLQGIYPALVQRFDVRPKGPARERPFIEANISATRQALGLAGVQVTDDYDATTTASAGQLRADAEALPGIRLVDPAMVAPTFEQLQQVRGYYSFPAVLDVDRYTVDGRTTDAVVAAREVDLADIPDRTWTNLHTVYTHGFGLVAAYGNRRQPNGEPVWLARDIPTTGALDETQGRIYFGERSDTYAVVGAPPGTPPVELDTPGGGAKGATETRTTYAGTGGVPIGNPLVRAMYALRLGDANLLLSTGRVNRASRILVDRQPRQRVRQVAPWLTVDSQPFPAVVDGRVVWILDGYTTSSQYPNAQQVTLPGASRQVNYVRNAVKAVVDAYNGSVTLYAWDESDPVLRTWQKAYPGLLQPRSAIRPSLLAHLRYPVDLFTLQRGVLGRYHTTNPDTWFQQSDLWEVPNDPIEGHGAKEAPNYLSIKWPGQAAPVFSLTSPMVPRGRENLGAYVAVDADATSKGYGTIRVLKLSDRQQVAGPGQTYNAMQTDDQVAARLTPYKLNGSAQAHWGNLLTIPLGGGLLYACPVYTQQSSTSGGYLVLRFVVVRFGEHVGIGTTLQEALDTVFKGDAGASTGEGDTPAAPGKAPAVGTTGAQQALAAASRAFDAADKALRAGDLAEYQRQLAVARQQVAAASTALR